MVIMRSLLACFSVLMLADSTMAGGGLPSPVPVTFLGKDFHEPRDLSAVAAVGDFLVIGSDEGNVLQILRRTGAESYELARSYSLPDGQELKGGKGDGPELDIEGIAANGREIYIIGSHSRKRGEVLASNPEKRSHKNNRDRLQENEAAKGRRVLFRLSLDKKGRLEGKIESGDLWAAIKSFKEFEPFTKIPGKENGIDIEGIAVLGKELYIGFRGPVFRENWVPVMVTGFDDPQKRAELRYINLDGLGIRDIAAVGDGRFLLIAGPVGDGPGGYHLYGWNGLDCIPGKKGAKGVVRYLGEIPASPGAKAEGLTLLPGDGAAGIRVLILFDGPEGGAPQSFTLGRIFD